MGILVPHDFSFDNLKNDEEKFVVRTLRDRLPDGWYVMPSVRLTSASQGREIDVVIAHESRGLAVIEVKGHARPEIRDGKWYSNNEPMKPQPVAQARENSYELREQLRAMHLSLAQATIDYAVAFPNVSAVTGQLPSELDRRQLFTRQEFDDCAGAVEALMKRTHMRPLGRDGVASLVKLLLGDCEFEYDAEALARYARRRLAEISELQVSALESLDANRRVCVTGSAGTGKTRLAALWARRALARGERVLVTCFNLPLANQLYERLGGDENITVEAFNDLALLLDGMPDIDIPDEQSSEWWNETFIGHLLTHWPRVTTRFDTIIIDEAQDFHPVWISLLEGLLDRNGPGRLMILADTAQQIFDRGFQLPLTSDGWSLCELRFNGRNTFQIASLLHRAFGGAIAPIGGPESESVRWIEASTNDAIPEAVGDAIDSLEDRDHGAETVLVLTVRSTVRDMLQREFSLTTFDDEDPMSIVCENVHRAKGLEYDHVIFVAHNPYGPVADDLLYVAASRAVMSLTVIGDSDVADRLGLTARA